MAVAARGILFHLFIHRLLRLTVFDDRGDSPHLTAESPVSCEVSLHGEQDMAWSWWDADRLHSLKRFGHVDDLKLDFAPLDDVPFKHIPAK